MLDLQYQRPLATFLKVAFSFGNPLFSYFSDITFTVVKHSVSTNLKLILPTANKALFGSNSKEQKNKTYFKMEKNFSELKKELQEIKQLTVLSAKKVLTMSDCALLTGLSKSHLYKKVWTKEIPYYKSQGGKLTYFNRSEIEEWCLKYRVKTNDELETEAAKYCVVVGKGGVK